MDDSSRGTGSPQRPGEADSRTTDELAETIREGLYATSLDGRATYDANRALASLVERVKGWERLEAGDGSAVVVEVTQPDPYHPDRDGCDCEKQGLSERDECVHDDPCWTSRGAYEATRPTSTTDGLGPSPDSDSPVSEVVARERDEARLLKRALAAEVRVAKLEKERNTSYEQKVMLNDSLETALARVFRLTAALTEIAEWRGFTADCWPDVVDIAYRGLDAAAEEVNEPGDKGPQTKPGSGPAPATPGSLTSSDAERILYQVMDGEIGFATVQDVRDFIQNEWQSEERESASAVVVEDGECPGCEVCELASELIEERSMTNRFASALQEINLGGHTADEAQKLAANALYIITDPPPPEAIEIGRELAERYGWAASVTTPEAPPSIASCPSCVSLTSRVAALEETLRVVEAELQVAWENGTIQPHRRAWKITDWTRASNQVLDPIEDALIAARAVLDGQPDKPNLGDEQSSSSGGGQA